MNAIRDKLNDPKVAIIFVAICIFSILIMFLLKGNDKKIFDPSSTLNVKKTSNANYKKTSLPKFYYNDKNPFRRGSSKSNSVQANDEVDDFSDLRLSFIMKKKNGSYAIIDNVKYFVGDKFKRYTVSKINRYGIEFLDGNKNNYSISMY